MGLGLKLIHISLRKLAERLVSWCFEPSQPQRITPGLNTDFNLSPGYSLHESLYGTYHQVIHFTSHCTALVIRLFISQVIVRYLSSGYSFHKSLYGTCHQVIHFTSHCTALVIRLFISKVIVRHLSSGYSFHKSLYGTYHQVIHFTSHCTVLVER